MCSCVKFRDKKVHWCLCAQDGACWQDRSLGVRQSPLAEELLVAEWGGLCCGAGETPYGVACISAWRKKSWMVAGWWRKQDPCHSHVTCCFIHLLLTWYPPVPSSATVLFLDSKSLPSSGIKSVEGREVVKGFETLLPKQPFNLSVCLAQSSLVSRKYLMLPIPDLFESFKL